MNILAKKKGGLFLSATYTNAKDLLRWQCGKGHKFKKNADSVLQGSWCPKCS